MNKLDLFSESYSPTGNVASDGVLNQLGRPRLDPLAVLVREAVQNSWDARVKDSTPVKFGISGWTATKQQLEILKRYIFLKRPPHLGIDEVLESSQGITLLALYDRGTEGLGGPTRADQIPDENEPSNFIDFLRNVGQPPDKQLAGGTYGYGKAVFYGISSCRTILVHSRCRSKRTIQSRFISAALGSPYIQNRKRYTGRHWWGKNENGIIEPVLDRDSEDLAISLGFPGFQNPKAGQKVERGTTVVILQPDFGERQPVDALKILSEYILWYFWPKMLSVNGSPAPIQFEMFWQNNEIKIPDITQFPPLDGFIQAMHRLKAEDPSKVPGLGETFNIESVQYKQLLGRLALERFAKQPRPIRKAEETAPIPGSSHHVALLRQPELVVRYLEGPELPSEHIEYCGVFITDKEVDKLFADSEPPTHDDWISNYLKERRGRTFINTALREIRAKMEYYVRPSSTGAVPGDFIPLGAFANQLGALLPGQPGTAAFASLFARRRKIASSFSPPKADLPTGGFSSYGQKTGNSSELFSGLESDILPEAGGFSNVNFPEINSGDPNEYFRPNSNDGAEKESPVMPRNIPKNGGSTSSGVQQKPSFVKIKRIEPGELILLEDQSAAVDFEFEIIFSGDPCTALVKVEVGALLDGDEIETDPPEGTILPKVICWKGPQETIINDIDQVRIQSTLYGVWHLFVSVPEQVMVGADITVSIDKWEA